MSELIGPDVLQHQQGSGMPPTVIGVRGTDEYAAGHIAGALYMPADELPGRLAEIPRDRPIVSY